MTRKIAVLVTIACALLLNGCAGYRLGTMLPPDVKTVFIPTFHNKSREPRIEVEATQKAIQGFQRDGSLSVSTRENADAVLDVTLTDYELTPVRYDSKNGSRTSEYRVWITADVVMKRLKDDTIIAERKGVRGKYVFNVVGDLTSSKLQALPKVCENLATYIVESVVEVWQSPTPASPAARPGDQPQAARPPAAVPNY